MRGFWLLFFVGALVCFGKEPAAPSLPEKPVLRPGPLFTNGWFRLEIQRPARLRYSVERSEDLRAWTPVAVLHGRQDMNAFALPFVHTLNAVQSGFYRVTARDISFEDDWRNQIFLSQDDFRSEQSSFGAPATRWIKFAIATNEPGRVYFQNSWKYKFHYDFAKARLPQFKALDRAQFDAVSLRTNAQQVVLGAVLFSPKPQAQNLAVQFVGQDPYAPEEIARWFEVVRAAIHPIGQIDISYIPTYEQAAAAANNREFFAARGIRVGSLAEWSAGENCYSSGWALGRLVYVPAAELVQAYSNGTLSPNDILLTDAVPAELPFLRGIITLSPSTPNSHVAILARSYDVPFAYFDDPALRAAAQALVGKEVIFTAYPAFPTADLRVFAASTLAPALRQQILDSKTTPPLKITPKERFGARIASTDNLTPADIRYFGGKAANFGFLRRQIPSNSPPAMAISFDLWDEYMDQLIAGVSLRTAIADRLSKHLYPPNLAALRADLEAIRKMIEDDGRFTSAQQQEIAAALLGRFDPKVKIRFRSSTNVEDTEQFVGAGLYDSYSGCLADDLDSDSTGPSACDPAEAKERGVFRAIRKVYASFYNENAVLERMRYRVDERQAGMAVLVHYSNPDETELANGVATVAFQKRATNPHYQAQFVTQKGAVSVTNPDGSAQPEVLTVSYSGFSPYLQVKQWSSLLPLGATVLNRDAEYLAFANYFSRVAKAFENYYAAKTNYTLDFEYKKIVPGELLVKQVRLLPTANPDSSTPTILLGSPVQWELFQGEYGDVVANHRLKPRLQFAAKDAVLVSSNLNQSFFGPIVLNLMESGALKTISGLPAAFPEPRHEVNTNDQAGLVLKDSWLESGKRLGLTAIFRPRAAANQSPFVSLADASVFLSADYAAPRFALDYDARNISVTNDSVRLQLPSQTNSRSILVTRTVPAAAGAAIAIRFYWPEPPSGVGAGYTAPLQKWVGTRIEGLTTEPILLKDYYSQTYRPEHHNFSENFIFEPAVEPGISASILSELQAGNIRYIYVRSDSYDNQKSFIRVAGSDWQFRPLAAKP